MERNLIEYLPYIVREYEEFRGIAAGEQPEFELAWNQTKEILDSQFILQAGNPGLSRWEKLFHIVPKATDSLEDRRFRVLSRFNEELPYTMPRLQIILQTLCGENNFTVEFQPETYELIVRIGLAAKNNFSDVASLLERVTPTNLLLDISLLYTTHAEIGQFTHAQLAAYSHHYLRNEVLSNG